MSELPVQNHRKGRGLKLLVVLAVLLAAGVAGVGGVRVWQNSRAYHLAVVQPGVLYRDGAKSEGQFAAALDEMKPRTVVSLVDAAEQSDASKPQFAAESKACEVRGVKLERIEVKLGGWPSSEDIRNFLAVVGEEKNRPVLVHCAQGVRRTAFFVAAYQMSVLGYDKEKAKNAILTFGHSDNTINDIRRFIDGYDGKMMTGSGQ
ncbi:MAG TPA: protein-tyrosine phosphatase family protein [Tepidisphaeraceae bacterium]|jgi:protein tyrosine/serine phosphatase